jgi:hypothetical protein
MIYGQIFLGKTHNLRLELAILLKNQKVY